jgi:hypothetical protein
MIYILEETMHFFLERHHHVQEDDSQETTADTTLSSRHADQLLRLSVERLDCKRPILWLASSKILTPAPLTARRVCSVPSTPPPPRLWCGGRTHSLGGEGVGGQYLEDARHSSVLYVCKYFVETESVALTFGVTLLKFFLTIVQCNIILLVPYIFETRIHVAFTDMEST